MSARCGGSGLKTETRSGISDPELHLQLHPVHDHGRVVDQDRVGGAHPGADVAGAVGDDRRGGVRKLDAAVVVHLQDAEAAVHVGADPGVVGDVDERAGELLPCRHPGSSDPDVLGVHRLNGDSACRCFRWSYLRGCWIRRWAVLLLRLTWRGSVRAGHCYSFQYGRSISAAINGSYLLGGLPPPGAGGIGAGGWPGLPVSSQLTPRGWLFWMVPGGYTFGHPSGLIPGGS